MTITVENAQALEDLKSGKKDKAVSWYRQKLEELKSHEGIDENAALQGQRDRMAKELEKLEAPEEMEREDQSNFIKGSKLRALGYTKQ